MRTTVRALWLGLVLLTCADAAGQTSADDAEAPQRKDENPCRLIYDEHPKAIDKVRGLVHRTVCTTAMWFDGLFGDPRAFEEAERTYGLVEGGGSWEEGDGVDGVGRIRIKWRLPALRQRLKLVVGRLPDERISREEEDPDGVADALDQDESEWVAGVDTATVDRRKHKVNVGGGVTYGDSLEPYIKLRSRSRWFFTKNLGLHVRLTPYWQDGDRRFGSRATIDLDHTLTPNVLMRWTTSGIHDRSTDGTRYFGGVVFYHQINDTYFMSNRVGVGGETGAEIPDRSYGFITSLRRSVLRDWLFLEISGGIDWRRELRLETRHSVYQARVVLEMHFGEVRGSEADSVSARNRTRGIR